MKSVYIIWLYMVAHEWVHFAAYIVFANAVSAMDAPTATSSAFYRWSFKFLNGIASNLSRTKVPVIENSPNFQAAVEKYIETEIASGRLTRKAA